MNTARKTPASPMGIAVLIWFVSFVLSRLIPALTPESSPGWLKTVVFSVAIISDLEIWMVLLARFVAVPTVCLFLAIGPFCLCGLLGHMTVTGYGRRQETFDDLYTKFPQMSGLLTIVIMGGAAFGLIELYCMFGWAAAIGWTSLTSWMTGYEIPMAYPWSEHAQLIAAQANVSWVLALALWGPITSIALLVLGGIGVATRFMRVR